MPLVNSLVFVPILFHKSPRASLPYLAFAYLLWFMVKHPFLAKNVTPALTAAIRFFWIQHIWHSINICILEPRHAQQANRLEKQSLRLLPLRRSSYALSSVYVPYAVYSEITLPHPLTSLPRSHWFRGCRLRHSTSRNNQILSVMCT